MRAQNKPDGYEGIQSGQKYPCVIGVELFTVGEGPNQVEDREETDYFIETYMPKIDEVACIFNPCTPEGNTNTTVWGYLPVGSKEEMDALLETLCQNNYRCKIEPADPALQQRRAEDQPTLSLIVDVLQEVPSIDIIESRDPDERIKGAKIVHHRLPPIRDTERYTIPACAPEPPHLRYHIPQRELALILCGERAPHVTAPTPSDKKGQTSGFMPSLSDARTQADAAAKLKLRKLKTPCFHS